MTVRYHCPNDDCQHHDHIPPVPNVVKCGACGAEMQLYLDTEDMK